jgi:hypothetical protein
MTTFSKMIYDVMNLVYGGDIPDDASLKERLVGYYIEEYRALLIRQELASRNKLPESFVQHLNCLSLESVDKSECCEVPVGCYVMRSVLKIPKFINTGGKDYIVAVQSIDGEQTFTETSFFRNKWNVFNKYTAKQSRYYIKNQRLYITNNKVIDKIMISGIFESPSELEGVNACRDGLCFTNASEYPITADMATKVTDMILKYRISMLKNVPKDLVNDSRDTVISHQATTK